MTIATGEPAGSTITTKPTRWSRIRRATETALAWGTAVTTPAVMISLSCTARTLHGDDRTRAAAHPVVPLEAGAGPDNPPCPACGEPLFGWIDSRAGLAGPVSRCESCGLGVVGEPGEHRRGAERSSTAGQREGGWRISNRAGFAAWIGGAGWVGLERGSRYLFTVEAVRRLAANRDQVVGSVAMGGRGGDRHDVADDPQRPHLRPQRRLRSPRPRRGCPGTAAPGSGASTPRSASSPRSRRCWWRCRWSCSPPH